MRRRTMLNLTAILFLGFALFAIVFILNNSKEMNNSFEISKEAPATNPPAASPKEEEKAPDNSSQEEVPQTSEKDWTTTIEKYKGKEIIKANTAKKAVAFTFDAGANADGVDKVLDILAQNNIKGTFFLTGKFIEKYPDKVKKIIASGGDIGNHSYDHPYFTKLTDDQIKEEIQKTESTLQKTSDAKFMPFLRSPYGDRNSRTLNAISADGYINIRWTVDSLGWKGTSGGMTAELVRQKVLKNAAPGAIIMMHLGSNPDDKTHLDSEALPDIISKLKEEGYEFLTLSELLDLEK